MRDDHHTTLSEILTLSTWVELGLWSIAGLSGGLLLYGFGGTW